MLQKGRRVRVLAASEFHSTDQLLKRQRTEQQHRQLSAGLRQFKTQAAAFHFLDTHQPAHAHARTWRVFAVEVAATGQRQFIVAAAQAFWQHYKQLDPSERHHYEIIREGCPCNLYFDLEYCPQTNPGVDGPGLVQLIISGVAAQLQQLYNLAWHDSYALEFDSSTPQKFSRHLIVQLPGLAFADACHAGRFARLVLLRLLQRGLFSSMPGQLLVANKDGVGVSTFVDMGVYTRNRAFRLYLSSKYGKEAVLKLTQRFGGISRCPRTAFFDSLVSVLHHSSSSSSSSSSRKCTQQQQQQPNGSSYQQQVHHVSLLHVWPLDWQAELQQLPTNWQQVAMLQLNPLAHQQHQQQHMPVQQLDNSSFGRQHHHTNDQLPLGPACVCHVPSPFPVLEDFINSICLQGGVQGAVRSWWVMPGSSCVCFNIKDNRWCWNVERQHRSNGIYYVADLAAGTYHQKCYDPECRHFRSNSTPLPARIWELYRPQVAAASGNNNADDVEEDDEQMLQLLQEVELQWQQKHTN